ncbi:MAG: FkbM family methyltransferase [Chloroflexota bacterium]
MKLLLMGQQVIDILLQSLKDNVKKVLKRDGNAETTDEAKIVHQLLDRLGYQGVMIDVGAHFGGTLVRFARRGWIVYAFEPDENNRSVLLKKFNHRKNVHISELAVSNKTEENVNFFSSPESTGISGLLSFQESHVLSQQVTTTTLDAIIQDHQIETIDFLKIDTEGFDLFVLEGFPWFEHPHPRVVICEFEDRKTKHLGYTSIALADFLLEKGYKILVSEWYPIEQYGDSHQWKRFFIYSQSSDSTIDSDAWGNFIAVHESTTFDALVQLTQSKG